MDIRYIPGDKNLIPDMLSRSFLKAKEEKDQEPNVDLGRMEMELEDPDQNLKECNDLSQRRNLIDKYHQQGHYGIRHILKQIQIHEKLSWPGIYNDIKEQIRACVPCAKHQIQRKGFHPLNSIEASLPWDLVAMDVAHMHSMEGEKAFNYCLIMVDVCTRLVALEPLENCQAITVGKSLSGGFLQTGIPERIANGWWKEFNAKVTEILEIASVQKHVTAPYHHSANGLAEANVKGMTTMLKKMLEAEKLANLADDLPFIQFYMNNRIHELTGSAAFDLFFGRASNVFQDYSATKIDLATEKEIKERWEYMSKIVYPNIQERVKEKNLQTQKVFDETHIIREFKMGDQCMYLRKEYADSHATISKWEKVYVGTHDHY